MNYRQATAVDSPLLARLNQQLIQDEKHRNSMSLAELEQRMAGWLQAEYEAILFENGRDAAGYVLFKRNPDHVYLRQFFVRRDRRRTGVGRAALAWLQANVWQDCPRIRLDVLVCNPVGIAFWKAAGFRDYCITMELDRSNLRLTSSPVFHEPS